ncbi:MAG: PAS domain S-box protein [Candidatus Electryonea clarkiae]|nr:PAS domain S-box protein [Candidatus Electryonea clarkiae]MDP8286958.1 PAS domain S-box protein [Candidatus Electryonea clarkiae]
MSEYKRLPFLILILTVVSLGIAAITISTLYQAAFEENRSRLVNIAQSRARLIESIAQYDVEHKKSLPDEYHDYDPFKATLSKIIEAHDKFDGFGKTGEFTMAQHKGEEINFLLRHRHKELRFPLDNISFDSQLAEPMRLALSGKSGTIIGLDYRGEKVLAAYEPVAVMDLGIVAKMDLKEVRAPYIKAGITAIVVSIFLIFFGAILFFRVTNPMIRNLAASEARLRRLFESRMTGVLFWNATGDITDANDLFLEMVGYSRDDLLLGKVSWADMTPPEYKKLDEIALEELASAGVSTQFEKEYIRKDGSRIPILVSAATLMESELNGVAFIQDITERKQAANERKSLEIHMRQHQKLESIGTLASGVAHEINNPINGIMNYAQLISDRSGEETKLKGYAQEIISETERVATIVRNLLTFSRDEKETHSPANIQDIVNDTISLVQTIIRHDQIALELDVPDNLPKIRCRSQHIQQVLMNLLTNARDALNERYPDYDENKMMVVKVRPFERENIKWIRMTVEDHGIGISEEIRNRIFDPFYTTKDRTKGTGLGLSISYGIVEDHLGELNVESEPGQYTHFHVDLRVNNGWTMDGTREEDIKEGKA